MESLLRRLTTGQRRQPAATPTSLSSGPSRILSQADSSRWTSPSRRMAGGLFWSLAMARFLDCQKAWQLTLSSPPFEGEDEAGRRGHLADSSVVASECPVLASEGTAVTREQGLGRSE